MANQAAPPAFKDLTESEYQKVVSKPVVQSAHVVPAEQANAVEVMGMAVDKHVSTGNYEAMCKIVKETMDRKYGPSGTAPSAQGLGLTPRTSSRTTAYYGKIGILLFFCRFSLGAAFSWVFGGSLSRRDGRAATSCHSRMPWRRRRAWWCGRATCARRRKKTAGVMLGGSSVADSRPLVSRRPLLRRAGAWSS